MNYELLVDKLSEYFTGADFEREVSDAKKEFFDRSGVLDEESDDFEMRMAQFLDWYLFRRKVSGENRTPVELALDGAAYPIEDALRPFYENLLKSRHSLFEFLKLKGEDVFIKDLFSGEKKIIKKSPVTVGFHKDELFEARLIPHEDNFIFAKSFCIHPPQVSKFIRGEVKKIRKLSEPEQKEARETFISRLFKMKHKHEQYKHVDVREIYSNESRLRI